MGWFSEDECVDVAEYLERDFCVQLSWAATWEA